MSTESPSPKTERLWTRPDGTVCLLSKRETPPHYWLRLVRHAQVLRERLLYGRASAQMLAQGWSDSGIRPVPSGMTRGDHAKG